MPYDNAFIILLKKNFQNFQYFGYNFWSTHLKLYYTDKLLQSVTEPFGSRMKIRSFNMALMILSSELLPCKESIFKKDSMINALVSTLLNWILVQEKMKIVHVYPKILSTRHRHRHRHHGRIYLRGRHP